MIILRSIIAIDKKTIDLDQLQSNLNEVPGWLVGSSLPLSKWNVSISTTSDIYELGEFDYPVKVHYEFPSPKNITIIKLYRTIGTNELYFELRPVANSGTIFDIKIEFKENN